MNVSIHKFGEEGLQQPIPTSIAAVKNAAWPLLMTAAALYVVPTRRLPSYVTEEAAKSGWYGEAKLTMTAGFFTRLPAALRGDKPILENFGTFAPIFDV